MFLRHKLRRKDGKQHRYWSIVENRRVAGGRTVQRHVLYLGEINDSQRAAWCQTIEAFDEGGQTPATKCNWLGSGIVGGVIRRRIIRTCGRRCRGTYCHSCRHTRCGSACWISSIVCRRVITVSICRRVITVSICRPTHRYVTSRPSHRCCSRWCANSCAIRAAIRRTPISPFNGTPCERLLAGQQRGQQGQTDVSHSDLPSAFVAPAGILMTNASSGGLIPSFQFDV